MPAPGCETYGDPVSHSEQSTIKQDVCDQSLGEPAIVQRCGYQGPYNNLENMGWRTINGPFVSVWLHNVPWGAEDTMAAPEAKVG